MEVIRDLAGRVPRARRMVAARLASERGSVGVVVALVIFLVPWLERTLKNRALFFGVILVLTLPGFFYCKSNDYFTSIGMLFGFMAAVVFEEKKVRFENTRNPIRMILRVLVGGGLYLGINSILKLPFPKEFLESGSYGALCVRCVRYAIVVFLLIGVYPMLFGVTDRLLARLKKMPESETQAEPEN